MSRVRLLMALAVCAVFLGGCGTFSGQRAPDARTPPAPPVARGGGYYLDDGPGEHPPANLETVPDAVPRVETLHRGALRPYVVMGRSYAPMTALEPYRARGVASWYGRRYHGKLTSTGETYDMYAMTAAHPTLPLPSYVRVTSVANGRSVIVRVNDRGPFIDSRLIDLSYTAAYKLGVISGGSALVDVELIMPDAPASITAAVPALLPVPVAATRAEASVSVEATKTTGERPLPAASERGGVFLQLAAFGSRENAEAYASRLRADVTWLADRLHVQARDGLFRVRAGPYANPGDARQTAERINQVTRINPAMQMK